MENIVFSEKIKVGICIGDVFTLRLTGSLIDNVFKKNGEACETDLHGSYESLIGAIEKKHYDLILLDIDMPEMSGMEVCVRIRRENGKSLGLTGLILISDNGDEVFRYLKVMPIGFVNKKNFGDDCEKAVEDYLTICALEKNKYLVIDLGTRTVRVDMNDIVYVECIRDYQYLHMLDGEVAKVHFRMKFIEDNLAPRGFIRVHKGYLVNFRYIVSIDNAAVRLSGGGAECSIPISRNRADYVKKLYLSLADRTYSYSFFNDGHAYGRDDG